MSSLPSSPSSSASSTQDNVQYKESDDTGSNESSGEEQFTCDICEKAILPDEIRYHCLQCKNSFDVCETCYFEEEKHAHQLQAIKPAPSDFPLFKYKDEKTGHSVFLGTYSSALPDSKTITENHIKVVLTIMEFIENPTKELLPIQKLFAATDDEKKSLRKGKTVLRSGILIDESFRRLFTYYF